MAMALRGKNTHYRIFEIYARHWRALADQCGVEGVWAMMIRIAEDIESAIANVILQLPEGYPVELAESIFVGVRKQAMRFLKSADASDPRG